MGGTMSVIEAAAKLEAAQQAFRAEISEENAKRVANAVMELFLLASATPEE